MGRFSRDFEGNLWLPIGPPRTSTLDYFFTSKRGFKKFLMRIPDSYYSLFNGTSSIIKFNEDASKILAHYSTPFSSYILILPYLLSSTKFYLMETLTSTTSVYSFVIE